MSGAVVLEASWGAGAAGGVTGDAGGVGESLPDTGKAAPLEVESAALLWSCLRLGLDAAARRVPAKSAAPVLPLPEFATLGAPLEFGSLTTGTTNAGMIVFIPGD